jgi:hypothetical protein
MSTASTLNLVNPSEPHTIYLLDGSAMVIILFNQLTPFIPQEGPISKILLISRDLILMASQTHYEDYYEEVIVDSGGETVRPGGPTEARLLNILEWVEPLALRRRYHS